MFSYSHGIIQLPGLKIDWRNSLLGYLSKTLFLDLPLMMRLPDVAFDILYFGDSSVIHRPLRERQQLLQNAIRPLSGRLELLIPEAGGLNSKRVAGKFWLMLVQLSASAWFNTLALVSPNAFLVKYEIWQYVFPKLWWLLCKEKSVYNISVELSWILVHVFGLFRWTEVVNLGHLCRGGGTLFSRDDRQ